MTYQPTEQEKLMYKKITPGVRLQGTDHETLDNLKSGEYVLFDNPYTGTKQWFGCCPTEKSEDPKSPFFHSVICGLGAHDVVEHEDGTITVSPSILVTRRTDEPQLWHGYLQQGIWKELR